MCGINSEEEEEEEHVDVVMATIKKLTFNASKESLGRTNCLCLLGFSTGVALMCSSPHAGFLLVGEKSRVVAAVTL